MICGRTRCEYKECAICECSRVATISYVHLRSESLDRVEKTICISHWCNHLHNITSSSQWITQFSIIFYRTASGLALAQISGQIQAKMNAVKCLTIFVRSPCPIRSVAYLRASYHKHHRPKKWRKKIIRLHSFSRDCKRTSNETFHKALHSACKHFIIVRRTSNCFVPSNSHVQTLCIGNIVAGTISILFIFIFFLFLFLTRKSLST